MTDTKTNGTKLSDELCNLIQPAFVVHSMLQGAIALLDKAEHLDDCSGDIFAARGLVAEAWKMVAEIYGDNETRLLKRLATIDEVAA